MEAVTTNFSTFCAATSDMAPLMVRVLTSPVTLTVDTASSTDRLPLASGRVWEPPEIIACQSGLVTPEASAGSGCRDACPPPWAGAGAPWAGAVWLWEVAAWVGAAWGAV